MVSLRPLEHLEDRSTPAVFNLTVDPGQNGLNSTNALTELRSVLAAAAANNESDTINLYPPVSNNPRLYTFSFANSTNLVAEGDGSFSFAKIAADGTGLNGITINGNGATFQASGSAVSFRFFDVSGSATQTFLTINDLKIAGGNATTNGGAVEAVGGAALTLNNSTLASNAATAKGGAVYLAGGSGATFNNVTLSGNSAGTTGGAVDMEAAAFALFTNSRLIGNSSTVGIGGVAATAGSFQFDDSTLSGNTGGTGGAVSVPEAVFNRDTILNNKATASGTGGVAATNLRVVQSYVGGNTASAAIGKAGGIQGTNVAVISSTVDGNTSQSTSNAGGIDGTTVTVTNSTVANNSSASTGAGGVRASTLAMTGSIVANNTSNSGDFRTAELQVTGAGSTSGGYNLIRANLPATTKFNTVGTDLTSTDSDQTKVINPLLGSAQANGGPVLTLALGASSPAINAGPTTNSQPTDGRGFPRAVGTPARSDIGAFEVQNGNAVGFLTNPDGTRILDDQSAQITQPFGSTPATTQLQTLVTDKNGNLVNGAIVRFAAPVSPTPTASAVFSGQGPTTGQVSGPTPSTPTVPPGVAIVSVTAGSTAGDYLVTASTTGGVPGSTINLRNTSFGISPPSNGTLSIVNGDKQFASANSQFAQQLKVQVVDANSLPIANVPITFDAPDTGASVTFVGGGTSITQTTDSNGFVALTVQANTIASATPYIVEASGPNVGVGDFSLTNRPAVASKVFVSSGSGQSALVNTDFANPLKALVTDAFGNTVLAGTSVTFTGPGSPTVAGATFSGSTSTSALTDANGIASVSGKANANGGSYTIDATVANGSQTANFSLNNIFISPPPPPPPAPVNQSPVITDIPDQAVVQGNSGTFSFGVFDAETPSASLVVTATTSDTNLTSFTLGGTGTNRTITVAGAAGQTGTATITVVVNDGQATSSDTFNVTVVPPTNVPPPPPPPPPPGTNTPPVISDVSDQTLTAGNSAAYPVLVTDAQTPAASLVVNAAAADTTLIPTVTVTGTGSNRTVNVTAGNAQAGGTTLVTVTVTDASGATATDTFNVTVPPTNVPPPPPPPVPSVALLGNPQFAVGSGAGGTQAVRYFDANQNQRFIVQAFTDTTGGVRTATGDFNGDGVPDVVIATGPGSPSQVQILDGNTGGTIFSFAPFEASFTGGVYVAAGDLTGDGRADLVVTPDQGGGPRARVLDGNGFGTIADFFAIDDPAFRGGARAAIGDLSGDGRPDLIVSAGFGGGPRIAGYDGKSIGTGTPRKLFQDFFLFEDTLRNGAFVSVGDVNGDGFADIVGGGGPGGAPRVLAVSGQGLLGNARVELANFFAGDTNSRGGARVAVKNLDNDLKADIVVGAGDGAGNTVLAYLGSNIGPSGQPGPAFSIDAFPGFTGGVYVG